MDRAFLDANVLFSAAWGDGGFMRTLWEARGVEPITSEYASAEARRNLRDDARIRVLDSLLRDITVARTTEGVIQLPAEAAGLPDDDRPILEAAIVLRATHLLTGNVRDFGPLFGRRVGGVLVLRPRTYLDSMRKRAR